VAARLLLTGTSRWFFRADLHVGCPRRARLDPGGSRESRLVAKSGLAIESR
jgi:hypothetical protein